LKRKWIIREIMLVLSIVLSLNLFMVGTGLAKNENTKQEASQEKGQSKQNDDKSSKRDAVSDKNDTSDKNDKNDKNNTNDKNDDKNHKNDKSDKDGNSVSGNVYKPQPSKHEKVVPRGLMIAYLKTEGTSAQAVIGDLLLNKYSVTDIVYSFKNSLGKGKLNVTGVVYGSSTSVTGGVYGTITVVGSTLYEDDNSVTGAVYSLSTETVLNLVKELREQLKTSSHTAVDKADALEQLAEIYDNIGQIENAIEVQKDAIKTNPRNLDSYKKLGQLLKTKENKDIKGFVNGEQVIFDVLPVIQSNRTLVPFRAISESLKAEVIWNQVEQSVTVSKNGVEVKLVIGSKIALVNGKEVILDTPAQLIKGRTFIPVRFLSESFRAEVEWEPETQSVVVNETE
jgi:tetratricopeptide (TPR) repeat protein